MRGDGYFRNVTPTADAIMALELCISDANKPLLLANRDFLPYVVDALLLDVDHPRAGMKPELKSWCQQHHAECLAQLAVFAPARETLRADHSVIPALEAVAEGGLTAEARQFAEAALLALSDKELHVAAEGQKHVMLSCACVCSPLRNLHHVLNAVACILPCQCLCLTLDRCACRSVGCAGHDEEDQRVADRARLRHMV